MKLVKMRNGQFAQVSEDLASKLIDAGKAAAYDLKKGKADTFKPLVVKVKKPAKKGKKKPRK